MSKTKAIAESNSAAAAETAIVPRQTTSWNAVSNLSEAVQIAELVAKSAALPDVRNAGVALLKILAGNEMGFGPFASLVDVHIIEGKPSVGAHLKAAAIKKSGKYRFAHVKCTREECDLEFFERIDGQWVSLGHTSLTLTEAVETGLAVKEILKNGEIVLKRNWRVSSKDMLFARCISQGYRQFCPDLTGGVLAYDPDELEPAEPIPLRLPEPAAPGEVVDAEFTVEVTNGKAAEPEPDPFPTPLMSSSEQQQKIRELTESLKFSAAQVSKALAARGVVSLEGLTAQQAIDMIAKLSELALKQKPAPAAATT